MHRVVLGLPGVGDPALHAVEHPVVAVPDRPGLHARRVGAGVGLGQAVREAALPARELGEVLLLQLLASRRSDRERAELVHGRDQRGAHADAGHLLDHDHGRQCVGARAAVLLRHVQRVEVRSEQRLGRLLGEASLLVHLGGERCDLGLGQRSDRLSNRLVFLSQCVNGVLSHISTVVGSYCTQQGPKSSDRGLDAAAARAVTVPGPFAPWQATGGSRPHRAEAASSTGPHDPAGRAGSGDRLAGGDREVHISSRCPLLDGPHWIPSRGLAVRSRPFLHRRQRGALLADPSGAGGCDGID